MDVDSELKADLPVRERDKPNNIVIPINAPKALDRACQSPSTVQSPRMPFIKGQQTEHLVSCTKSCGRGGSEDTDMHT